MIDETDQPTPNMPDPPEPPSIHNIPAQPAPEAPADIAENLPASVPDATGDETPPEPQSPLKMGAPIPPASERPKQPPVPVFTRPESAARARTLPQPVPLQPGDEGDDGDDGETAELSKALPRDAEAPLYSPVPFEVRREFGGRPIVLRPRDVTWVPTRAADVFVGQNNTGGQLHKIGVRRLIVAGPRYDAAARAAGVSCRQFCHDMNARIEAEANAAYDAHVATQQASK